MKRTIILFLTLTLLISACTPDAIDSADIADRPIKITTTIGMITDIVRNVGGDRVEVKGLMGPGVDPHLYKASESDVSALQDADVIFYNGLHLEAGISGVLERMSDNRKVVAVTDTIDQSQLYSPPEYEGAYDPHIWFDVSLWMQAVDVVRDTLVDIDPGSTDFYDSNAKAYLAELEELHNYVREQAELIPQEKRVLITAHDAFSYFGRAYGFDVRGLQGISTESEASTADVKQLADFITESKIPAIFVESSVPQRNVEALQKAVESRGWDVLIG
ncbi:MAG TPA: zinc ABC transporter substrate-binding protein, partial [Anaerolineaceae bacterium]|nr:zinc ABC transporter substrate-binding protein [Anaerolineaceae bacterium]